MRGRRERREGSSLCNIDRECQKQAARAHGAGITDINPHSVTPAGGPLLTFTLNDRMAGKVEDNAQRSLS